MDANQAVVVVVRGSRWVGQSQGVGGGCPKRKIGLCVWLASSDSPSTRYPNTMASVSGIVCFDPCSLTHETFA